MLFGVDILLAFFSEYVDMAFGEKIRQPKKIAKRYLKGGFWIDFVSTLPLILKPLINRTFEKGSNIEQVMTNFVTGFRLMKLLRIRRLNKFITNLEQPLQIKN